MTIIDTLLKDLKEARRAATMERASFDTMGGSLLQRTSKSGDIQSEPQPETEYIVERTALYRDTWIVSPLDSAIALVERNGEMFQALQRLQHKLGGNEMQVIEDAIRANQKDEHRGF